MSWFKRTKDPLVTDDYLQTAETVSRPMAIVYTIVMVFVIGAVAFSIFFGVRWLYQNLDGSNKPAPTVVTSPITSVPEDTGSTSSASANTSASTTNSSAGTTNGSTTTTSSSSSAATSSAGGSATTGSGASANAAVATATAIPATGPTNIAVLFISVVVLSALIHHAYMRRRA